MAKKRTLKTNTLHAEFWTALPINACRERIVALQRRSVVSHQAPSTNDPTFSTFTLGRYHHLTFWQCYNWPFGRNEYQLTIEGSLQTTTDGTHVSLKLAPGTKTQLNLETGLARWLMAYIAFFVAILGLSLLRILFSYLSGETPVPTINGDTIVESVKVLVFLSIWSTIMWSGLKGRWTRHRDLATTAQAVINSIHRELHVVSYQPVPKTSENAPLPN